MSDLYSELLVKKRTNRKRFHSQIWNDRTDSPGSGRRPFYQSDPSSRCSCVRCCILFCDSADGSGV